MARRFSGRLVRSRWATSVASIFSVPGSTSTNTGVAPARTIALAEAKKLNAVVMTESPGFTPAATSASQRASVPDAQPTAYCAPVRAAISRSSASTSGPRIKCCESHTRAIAASTSSRLASYWQRKSSSGTDSGAVREDGVAVDFTERILAGLIAYRLPGLGLLWRCALDDLALDNMWELRPESRAGEMLLPIR